MTSVNIEKVIRYLTHATEQLKTDPRDIEKIKIALNDVIAVLEGKDPINQLGGKGKKKGGRKKKGGADVNMATQGAQIMNTGDLLQNPFNPVYATKPWEGPMPFSAGMSIPNDLTAGLPTAGVLASIDPAITVGGGKKKGKKAAPKKTKAAPKKTTQKK